MKFLSEKVRRRLLQIAVGFSSLMFVEAEFVAPMVRKFTSHNSLNSGVTRTVASLNIQNQSIDKIKKDAPLEKQEGFINQVGYSAIYDFKHDKNCQVAPSIVIAQAIVESDWGQSGLYNKAHNIFGVKGNYRGKHMTFPTTEVINGKSIMRNSAFRYYPNLNASVYDHNVLLRNQFIGKNHAMNYKQDAYLLRRNHYATDPSYPQKLIAVINTYHLYRYDKLAE